jgi:hypothetical protein
MKNTPLERLIGAIYAPIRSDSHITGMLFRQRQFDGYLWFDETNALDALEVHQLETPQDWYETYPFGV